MKTVQIIFPAILLTFSVGFAYSDTQGAEGEVMQRSVTYADLDLNDIEGVKRLHHRIRAAARTVCGASTSQPLTVFANLACVRSSTSAAVTRADIRQLTAYHSQQIQSSFRQRVATRR